MIDDLILPEMDTATVEKQSNARCRAVSWHAEKRFFK
jgi:hypothetical protein